MAKLVFENPFFEVNSVALSDYVESLEFRPTADKVESTGPNDDDKTYIMTKKGGTIAVTLQEDYDAGKVEATLEPLFGTTTTVKWRPDVASVSASNPERSCSVCVEELPSGGPTGDLMRRTCTWTITGAVTRSTS